jgi:CheY-like chemotaxis protein
VRKASCGNGTLDLFRRARSDLILSDLEMPDISGCE